jgi:hypothetical protein
MRRKTWTIVGMIIIGSTCWCLRQSPGHNYYRVKQVDGSCKVVNGKSLENRVIVAVAVMCGH